MKNLGKCPDYALTVERILNDIFDDNFNFTTRDWSRIVRLLVDNPVSHSISLNFLLQHLDRMNNTYVYYCNQYMVFLTLVKFNNYNFICSFQTFSNNIVQ